MTRRAWLPVAMLVATLASLWLTAYRLRISSDLSALFPDRAASVALARFVRAFGGGDLAAVLLRGDDAQDVEAAAHELSRRLEAAPSISRVVEKMGSGTDATSDPDPTLAWRYAGPRARAALAEALTPAGMRARLDATRELLLAPGSSGAESWLAKDPLRLAVIPWEGRRELAAGVTPGPDGSFVADGGRARLVVLSARGSAFDTDASDAFVQDTQRAFAAVEQAHPHVTIGLTGGHAIAHATRALLIRDLAISGTLSLVLASLTFVVTFRRARALFAVIPPLLLGTLWTTGLAAFVPGGLSAIAIGFAAVVVGVGVDTGVHVYAALLDARRSGLPAEAAAREARARTARPTLLAAGAAGIAFGSLALSDLAALRQLGLLCAAGEVLTAVAIVLVTPAIGAWLEKGPPPAPLAPRWLKVAGAMTSTRKRAWTAFGIAGAMGLAVVVVGVPKGADALVAVRPHGIAPLVTQAEVYRLFGGRPGQWIVLTIDADEGRAIERSDAVSDALESLATDHVIEGFDSASAFAPAPSTQARRIALRDALDLPGHRRALAAALADRGFDAEACAAALAAFENPTPFTPSATTEKAGSGVLDWMRARHVARDGADTLVATFVRPTGSPANDERAIAAVRAADPQAVVTGYPYLEKELAESLAHDLPRVAAVALLLVGLALRAMLGRARDVALALATIASELASVALVMRALHLRWHVYDALVLPVLVGVTIDESMFLLHAARAGKAADPCAEALRAQGPLVASTALTTAAGFAALLACSFDGLWDLGAVGAIGVLIGLVSALVLVPAGLRLQTGDGSLKSETR